MTVLLTDDLFKDDEELMKDEISTFILASTQTTSALLTNLLYYQEFIPNIRSKLIKEICYNFSDD